MSLQHHSPCRQRRLVFALVFVVLAPLSVILLARAADQATSSPVYTVAALRADLARQPAAWLDRPLRVRAIARRPFRGQARPLRVLQIAAACSEALAPAQASPCLLLQPDLIDPGAQDDASALPLTPGPLSPLVALLHRVPFIDAVAPMSQEPRWGALAVYRIELHALPCSSAPQSCAYEALLLDAAS